MRGPCMPVADPILLPFATLQLVNQVLGQSASASVVTVVRGFAKVFVGEIVEKGAFRSSSRRASR